MGDSVTIYVAAVYGPVTMASGHPTLRDAFQWVKQHVGGVGDPWTHGDVRLGDALLVYFDPRETIWYGDGFARWESGR